MELDTRHATRSRSPIILGGGFVPGSGGGPPGPNCPIPGLAINLTQVLEMCREGIVMWVIGILLSGSPDNAIRSVPDHRMPHQPCAVRGAARTSTSSVAELRPDICFAVIIGCRYRTHP